ncbi:type I restriction enzyme M protein [Salegentibacter echinorum]|uniref:site-specific DNA-methyltransferase (adenine-specific) n=1 Tax=Salegentibacter echinorum TaxID=1073325 RepID=A0A1M5ID41_SALEC|nr:type I restriction-modification system subunit M [Salegentibacter echinorum]SHG26155.1 type I restriction enzyme M protein [Salegentibacter echinorum]
MTNEQLKELEDKLWDAANSLRAYGGLKASDYAVPVLGLIFLKFAENKYSQFEPQIKKEFEKGKGTRMERKMEEIALATCGFYLPEEARFDTLLNLPGDQSLAKALKAAMVGIEKHQDAKFQDVLPTEAYFDIEKKKADILPQLLKAFSDIPKEASGDVFGKIYEYFLGKFAMAEGQKGGEFFTPISVVRFIVEVIEPFNGKILDPACGSGGMFVQSARFVEQSNQDLKDIYVCGQEYMGETVRLAKMNLLVNNLRGEIIETNSYENDPHESYGKFDYVMANPPFNVKSVKESTVKNDPRFYEYGLPKNKGKKDDKISDANYLWISLFATSLKPSTSSGQGGRAGFVMPNSASDARNAEYEIRKKIVDSGIVDCMVSMPSNMFFTVTLPATLWFFDKQKVHTDRKDKILFLDARNVYRQIDRAHREWTEEQQQNLAAIVRLYRGETERYLELIDSYLKQAHQAENKVEPLKEVLVSALKEKVAALKKYTEETETEKRTPTKKEIFEKVKESLNALFLTEAQQNEEELILLQDSLTETPLENEKQKAAANHLAWKVKQNDFDETALKKDVHAFIEIFKEADKKAKLKSDKTWVTLELSKTDKKLEEALTAYTSAVDESKYWFENIDWLQKRFPEAKYQDVVGLCKMADRTEYVEEQDYSLNAGRYVGVEIEDDNITKEEFNLRLKLRSESLAMLNSEAHVLESQIENRLNNLIV